ncbi:MAG TPA: hypothetical protein VMU83_14750 [Hanamia sp.]|nr:hypothetical protein [Hanamia sp.]
MIKLFVDQILLPILQPRSESISITDLNGKPKEDNHPQQNNQRGTRTNKKAVY